MGGMGLAEIGPFDAEGPDASATEASFPPGLFIPLNEKETTMKWTKPQYQDLRFGFEITMYIAAR